jgi:hypothetical protein
MLFDLAAALADGGLLKEVSTGGFCGSRIDNVISFTRGNKIDQGICNSRNDVEFQQEQDGF